MIRWHSLLLLCAAASRSSVAKIPTSKHVFINSYRNPDPSTSTTTITKKRLDDALLIKSIFIPWLYFMAVNINLPSLPKLINIVVNNGNPNASPEGQRVYGNLSGFDALFTFLSVNVIGRLSDRYGRKPFMMYSALGLGLGYFICSHATASRVFYFYVSGSIDGLTSCMFSQSQAYISDIAAASQKDLSVALSQFQGLAIGLAFMLGIPLGGYLGARYSSKAPLYVSMALCVACSLLIWWALPETVDTNAAVHPSLDTEPWWRSIYPARALSLLTRTKQLRAAACCYYLLNFAHAGIQIVWMNYLQRVFGWPAHISALTLAIVGLTVAVLPKLFIPRLGVRTSIKLGLLLHGLSLLLIGLISSQLLLFCVMPLFALGASALPVLLGHIASQVDSGEIGAVQGAAETVRTMATMLSYPITSRVFAHFISDGRAFPEGALYFASAFSLVAAAVACVGL